MPEQGDKKIYIGDIWADKDKSEYQKKFIEDILEVHQHHGYGFDADMVDGYHATDFATAQQGILAETALQPFYLGETLIDNTLAHHYITTEAIELLERTKEAIPWTKWYDPTNSPEGVYEEDYIPDDLTEAIEFLYQLILNDINDVDSRKVEKECVRDETGQCVRNEDGSTRMKVLSDNNFEDHHKHTVEFLENQDLMSEVTCFNCADGRVETGTKTVLNAGTINGLQLVLITEEDYEELPQNCRDNWRNVFIFVEDYPAEYDSPLNCSFKNGFIFRVSPDGQKIQYKNKDNQNEEDWLDLVDMDEVYNAFWNRFSSGLHETIINTINNDGDLIAETINDLITQDTIINGMLTTENIDEDILIDLRTNPAKYAFMSSSLIDDFVYRAYYQEDGDESNPKMLLSMNPITVDNYTFKELSLNQLVRDYTDKIESKADFLTESLTNSFNSLLPANLKSTYPALINTTIPSINTQLRNLSNRIDTLSSNLGTLDAPNTTTAFGKIRSLEQKLNTLEEKEEERNKIHVSIGRWSSKTADESASDFDVNGNYTRIEMNVYNSGVPENDTTTLSANPDGIFVRVNNKSHPESAISGKFLNLGVHLTIQGLSNNCSNRFAEYWCAFSNNLTVEAFSDKLRKFIETKRSHNYQTYYNTNRIPIRWQDVTTKGETATYMIKAVPYSGPNGFICGNIVRIPLIVKKP